jgi:hypothetical protein
MTTARCTLVNEHQPGCYHLVTRCVRRAFLCGNGYDHRKEWLLRRIRHMSQVFAVDVLAVAVMSNHLHLVVKNRPDRAKRWTPATLAERWAQVFPRRDQSGQEVDPNPLTLAAWASDPAWVATHRQRLASLSWFMKCVKEPLARIANRQDGCTGAFWEARFHSVALLDQTAVTACMAYVDLNPIRAAIATTPENSDCTSVQARIQTRENFRKRQAIEAAQSSTASSAEQLRAAGLTHASGPESPLWLTRIAACTIAPESQRPCLSLDDYLTLVDATGRIIRHGKRGAIPATLAPILDRLDLDLDRWLDAVTSAGRFLGSAIGSAAARALEAARRGVAWIVDKARIHRPPQAATG